MPPNKKEKHRVLIRGSGGSELQNLRSVSPPAEQACRHRASWAASGADGIAVALVGAADLRAAGAGFGATRALAPCSSAENVIAARNIKEMKVLPLSFIAPTR